VIQVEPICFPEYGTKIPNHNTQITSNINISNSNEQIFQSLIGCIAVILSVLNFEFRLLIFVCDLYFACPPSFWRGAWIFHDFHKPVTLFIPSNSPLK
jgi:hypothetical protein